MNALRKKLVALGLIFSFCVFSQQVSAEKLTFVSKTKNAITSNCSKPLKALSSKFPRTAKFLGKPAVVISPSVAAILLISIGGSLQIVQDFPRFAAPASLNSLPIDEKYTLVHEDTGQVLLQNFSGTLDELVQSYARDAVQNGDFRYFVRDGFVFRISIDQEFSWVPNATKNFRQFVISSRGLYVLGADKTIYRLNSSEAENQAMFEKIVKNPVQIINTENKMYFLTKSGKIIEESSEQVRTIQFNKKIVVMQWDSDSNQMLVSFEADGAFYPLKSLETLGG